jgi:hypothetical protein
MSAFVDPLGGTAEHVWEELTADLHYSSSRWLRFCADDPGGETIAGAVTAGRAVGGPSAAVAVTAIAEEGNSFYDWDVRLRGLDLPTPGQTGLMAGQRRGYQTTLLYADGVDRDTATAELLPRILDAAEEGCVPGPARVAMFLSTPDVVALRRAGAVAAPVALAADAWIPVDADDWAGWRGRHRPEIIRRDESRFIRAGYRIAETTLAEFVPHAARLQAATQARYGHSADEAALAASFAVQGRHMGDAARVVYAEVPGEPPVGFSVFYVRGETTYLRTAGFDYSRLRGAAEYFNVCYYEPLRAAIAAGCRWLHAGIEAAEAKALRGAELRPLWLLDLDPYSRLTGYDCEIRAHNRALHADLAASSAAVRQALVHSAWTPFC